MLFVTGPRNNFHEKPRNKKNTLKLLTSVAYTHSPIYSTA